MSAYDRCANCGGDKGLHQYQTNQCPVGGVDAPIGREQEWKTSTFAPIPFAPPERLARDMTIREHFAALAMQAFVSQSRTPSSDKKSDWSGAGEYVFDSLNRYEKGAAKSVADFSVSMADALIEALNKEPKQ